MLGALSFRFLEEAATEAAFLVDEPQGPEGSDGAKELTEREGVELPIGCTYAAFRVRCIRPLCRLSRHQSGLIGLPAKFEAGSGWRCIISVILEVRLTTIPPSDILRS